MKTSSLRLDTGDGGDYEIVERLTQGTNTVDRKLAFRIEGADSSASSAGEVGAGQDEAMSPAGLQLRETTNANAKQLVIPTLPGNAAPRPTSEQMQGMIQTVRKRALEYGKTLPNFLCVEVTNRFVDPSGNGRWKHRDSIAEMLSYRDDKETRTLSKLTASAAARNGRV